MSTRIVRSGMALGLTVLVAAGCLEMSGPAPAPSATFTGRWTGQPWAGNAGAWLTSDGAGREVLYISGMRPVGSNGWGDQRILIRAHVTGPGVYALSGDAIRVTDLLGGDGVVSEYTGAVAGGTLTIIRYDGPGTVIEGTLSFDVQRSSPQDDGIIRSFSEGWFRATVVSRP